VRRRATSDEELEAVVFLDENMIGNILFDTVRSGFILAS
jgi:hypothetical protein